MPRVGKGAGASSVEGGHARVAVVRQFGEPLEMTTLPLPGPEPGALLVEVAATTICGSDLHLTAGDLPRGIPVRPPLVPGHEMVGRVAQFGLGAEVDSVGQRLELGDRVVWTAAPCGHCHVCVVVRNPSLCPNRILGCFQSCEQFPYVTGTFGDYSYVYPTSGRLKVPDDLPDHWASAASCALRTAIQMVDVAGAIRPTDHVVVQGSGPVGLCAAAVAGAAGAATVTVVGAPADRLEVARAWGATETIAIEDNDPAARRELVLEATEGRGADLILECAGAPGAVAEGLDLAAINARYVIAGTVGGPAQAIDVQRITLRGLRLFGVFSAYTDAYWKALQFMRRYRDRIDWELLFGNRYSLSEADAALQAMRDGHEIKPIIVP